MKKPFVRLLATFALITLPTSLIGAAFQGTTYESFDYADATLISSALTGGTGWNATGDPGSPNLNPWGSNSANGTGQASRHITAGSLNYTATGYAAPAGNRASMMGSGLGRILGQTIDSGTFYFSYRTQKTTAETRTLNLAFFNNTTEKFAVGEIGSAVLNPGSSGNFALLMTNAQNTTGLILAGTPIAYGLNIPHLVIGRVDWDVGSVAGGPGAERIRIYIDPADVTSEPLTPYIDYNGTDLGTGLTQFRLFAGAAAAPFGVVSGDYDELRFGATFASVVTVGTKPTPYITGFSLTGDALNISGTNGSASGTYYLLTSTNVSLSFSNWTRLATNAFDGTGNFNFTTNIDSTLPQQFYLISQ